MSIQRSEAQEDENTAMLERPKSNSKSSNTDQAKKTTTHSSGIQLGKQIKILERPRITILIIIGLAVVTLIFNIAWLSWASSISKRGYGDSIIFRGSCSKVKNLKLWLHLLVNILSTILVSGSNYCIQSLNAPTREEVDEAHTNGQSCRIGIYDLSNLFKITWAKRWTIFVLSFSSWTLHLVYNATILSSLSTTSYHILGVTSSFFTNGTFNLEGLSMAPANATIEAQHWQANFGLLQSLNNSECVSAYIDPLVEDRGDLLLVLDDQSVYDTASSNSSIVTWNTPCLDCGTTLDWLCEGLVPDFTRYQGGSSGPACTEVLIRRNIKNADHWTVSGGYLGNKSVPIRSCLSQQAPERCALEYSRAMTIVVICWNAVKIACMVVAALSCRHTLMTVGDAIHSFLKRPVNIDTSVPATETDFAQSSRQKWLSKLGVKRETLHINDRDRFFSDHPQSWWRPVSRGRAVLLGAVSTIIIVLTSVYLAAVIHHLNRLEYPTSFGHLWTLGFGGVSGFSLLTGTHTGIVGNSVIANLPQLMVSAFYFVVNGIMTSQLAEREWNRFGYQWRRIRVSFPTDEAASFYLSLPYAYSGPLLVLFVLLHLSVSQALYAVEISFYTYDGKSGHFSSHYNSTTAGTEGMTFSTLGSSALSTIVAFFLFGVVLVMLVANSFRRYRTEMPFPGTQSIVIAASARSAEDADELLSKVIRWKRRDSLKAGELRWGNFVSRDDQTDSWQEGGQTIDKSTHGSEC